MLDREPALRRTFVGREAQLQQLLAGFDASKQGEGSLFMVAGEPGIGKTALCEQLMAYASLADGQILIGHCHEEGSLSLPYVAFVEALHDHLALLDREGLQWVLGMHASAIARLLPEFRARLEIELPPPGDPEEERYRLMQGVVDFLRSAAETQPLVLILEDLHDADRGTLDLLLHLARGLHRARLLVVGTYRDVEVDRAHPLSSALADLRRLPRFERLALRGLTGDEVGRMVMALMGQDANASFLDAMFQQTEGNPLFVQEVLRYLVESGRLGRPGGRWPGTSEPLAGYIPEGLRDVIGKRLSGLSRACDQLLGTASVIGREFRLDLLQQVSGLADDDLDGALDEARRAGLIEERVTDPLVIYRFSHALFRQVLYDELVAPRRNRLHQRVTQELERIYVHRIPDHAAELAEHASRSADPADLAKAVEYGVIAAQRASAVYAHGEAARLLDRAIRTQEVADADDRERLCDLRLALGEALLPGDELRRVTEHVAKEAYALAEAVQDKPRAARACNLALDALRRSGGPTMWSSVEWRQWAERLHTLAEPDTIERVRADMALGFADFAKGGSTYPADPAEGWESRHRLLMLAERLGDAEGVFRMLAVFAAQTWPPSYDEQRRELIDRFSESSRAGASPVALGHFLIMASWAYLAWGDRSRSEAFRQEFAALVERTQDSHLILRSTEMDIVAATVGGLLEDAVDAGARLVAQATELGRAAYGRAQNAFLTVPALLYLGRAEEALAGVRVITEATGVDRPSLNERVLEPLCLAHLGQMEQASKLLSAMIVESRADVAEDQTIASVLSSLLQTAIRVDDRETSRLLALKLARMVSGALVRPGNISCIARPLGAAAALAGERIAARGYYEQGLQVAGRIGLRPEIAMNHLMLAELLLDSREVSERPEALEHLNIAAEEFRAMRMAPSLKRALDLLRAPGHSAPGRTHGTYPAGLTEREMDVLRLLALGQSSQQIAHELVLSVRTVERHLSNIYAKLDVRTRAQATAYALTRGLVAPD